MQILLLLLLLGITFAIHIRDEQGIVHNVTDKQVEDMHKQASAFKMTIGSFWTTGGDYTAPFTRGIFVDIERKGYGNNADDTFTSVSHGVHYAPSLPTFRCGKLYQFEVTMKITVLPQTLLLLKNAREKYVVHVADAYTIVLKEAYTTSCVYPKYVQDTWVHFYNPNVTTVYGSSGDTTVLKEGHVVQLSTLGVVHVQMQVHGNCYVELWYGEYIAMLILKSTTRTLSYVTSARLVCGLLLPSLGEMFYRDGDIEKELRVTTDGTTFSPPIQFYRVAIPPGYILRVTDTYGKQVTFHANQASLYLKQYGAPLIASASLVQTSEIGIQYPYLSFNRQEHTYKYLVPGTLILGGAWFPIPESEGLSSQYYPDSLDIPLGFIVTITKKGLFESSEPRVWRYTHGSHHHDIVYGRGLYPLLDTTIISINVTCSNVQLCEQ
jgi:hypothetical protein